MIPLSFGDIDTGTMKETSQARTPPTGPLDHGPVDRAERSHPRQELLVVTAEVGEGLVASSRPKRCMTVRRWWDRALASTRLSACVSNERRSVLRPRIRTRVSGDQREASPDLW